MTAFIVLQKAKKRYIYTANVLVSKSTLFSSCVLVSHGSFSSGNFSRLLLEI